MEDSVSNTANNEMGFFTLLFGGPEENPRARKKKRSHQCSHVKGGDGQSLAPEALADVGEERLLRDYPGPRAPSARLGDAGVLEAAAVGLQLERHAPGNGRGQAPAEALAAA